jgi:hypothetical protein
MGNPVSGDASRNAAFLAVSNNILGDQKVRYGKQDLLDKWIPIIDANKAQVIGSVLAESNHILTDAILLEQELIQDGSSLIKTVGDSLADAIRAAAVQYNNEKGMLWANNSGSYGAFKEMYRKIAGMEKIKGQNVSPKKITPVVLSMLMTYCIQKLSNGYPMKKVDVDMIPAAKEILKKIGKSESTKLEHSDLETLISQFRPEKYEKIPQFDPVLGDFWKSITSAVVLRTASTFSKNATEYTVGYKDGEDEEVGGGEKSGEKKNTSGGV